MAEQGNIPEPHCFYCDEQNCDHKHGKGSSCGDCCGLHGHLCHLDKDVYDWVESCLTAKNTRLAALEELVAQLKVDRDEMKRQRDMLLNSDRHKHYQALEAENLRLKAPVSDEEWAEFVGFVTVVAIDGANSSVALACISEVDALLMARTGGSNGK